MKRLRFIALAAAGLGLALNSNSSLAAPAGKAKDVVCGMDVDPAKSLKSEYRGQTYYFCSKYCKDAFDKNPSQYLAKQSRPGTKK